MVAHTLPILLKPQIPLQLADVDLLYVHVYYIHTRAATSVLNLYNAQKERRYSPHYRSPVVLQHIILHVTYMQETAPNTRINCRGKNSKHSNVNLI